MHPQSLFYTFAVAILGLASGAAIPPTTIPTPAAALVLQGLEQDSQRYQDPTSHQHQHQHPKRLMGSIPYSPQFPQGNMTIECPDKKQPLCKAFSNYTTPESEKKAKKIKITIGAVVGGMAAVSIFAGLALLFTGVVACSMAPGFMCPCIIV